MPKLPPYPWPAQVDDKHVEQFKKPHFEGPLPLEYPSCIQHQQYFGKYHLSTLTEDNCRVIDDEVGIIRNILGSREACFSDSFVVSEFENGGIDLYGAT